MSKKIALSRMLALLPLPITHAIATIAAKRLFRQRKSYSYKTATKNISVCFAELDHESKEQLVLNTLVNNAKTMAETPYIWFSSHSKITKLYGRIVGEELFINAKSNPDGCLLLCPHIGNWEIIGTYLGKNSINSTMYLPSKQGEKIDQAIRTARSRFGSTLLPANAAGVKSFYKALKRGELVSMLPDQSPGSDAGMVFAPFFNQQTATISLPVKLAQRPRVRVLLGYSIRNEDTGKFDIHFEALDQINHTKTIEEGAEIMNNAIESLIRRYPSQYLWTYKRFKRRPKGTEQDFY